MVKTTAPLNKVPLRPIASPMRPAASEVTVEHQSGLRGMRRASEFFEGRTECADFQHRDHEAQLAHARLIEVFHEIGSGDDAGHNAIADQLAGSRRMTGDNQPLIVAKLCDG